MQPVPTLHNDTKSEENLSENSKHSVELSAPTPTITPSVNHKLLQVASQSDVEWGKWVHKHKNATESLGGFLGYQIIRNALAAIPYGVATAGVWLGMEKIAEKTADKNPNIASAMRSPLRDVVMIAAGFTLFRGTLKVVRFMKERLFNPAHTEEQSIQEVQNFKENLKDTFREVAPAEVASTPAAAIALGIGRRFWNPAAFIEKATGVVGKSDEVRKAAVNQHAVTGLFKSSYHGGNRWEHIKRVFGKKGGYLQEAGIVAASFVPFFELGDRRYKDAQVSRGIWLNDPTSLVRKSDEQAKAELVEGAAYIDSQKPDNHVTDSTSRIQNDLVRKSAESLHATGHLRPTDAPTFGCFAMRRVVPTFMGIGAYVAGKRLAYLGMGTIPENYNVNKKGLGGFLSNLGKIALIEGAATSLFWLNSSVIDKFEPWYDKTFKDNKAKPLTDQEMRKHYLELQAKLDAKEMERKGGMTSVG